MTTAIVKHERDAALTSFEDMARAAEAIAKSGLFGLRSKDQVLALGMVAQAEGRPFATAARDYHVIQGRPALRSDAILARFQEAGGKVEWLTRTDTKVSAVFTHPQGGSTEVSWDIERAKQADIYGGTWKKYPRQMLTARVISEGVRIAYAPAVCGFYTPEEVQDFAPAEPGRKPREEPPAATPPEGEAVAPLAPAPDPAPPAAADTSQRDFDEAFPPGPVPPPEAKPKTTTNFKFLKAMKAMKEDLGEGEYRQVLRAHQYEHADNIIGRAEQEKVFRAMKAANETKKADNALPM